MEVEGEKEQQQEPRLALPLPNPFIATDLTVKDLPPGEDPLSSSLSSSVVPPSLLPSASPLSLLRSSSSSSSSSSSNNNNKDELDISLQRLQADCPEITPLLSQIHSSLPPSFQYHYPTLLPSLPSSPSFDALHLWHLQDRVFRTPRASVYLKLATPHAYASPRHEAMTELFIRLVRDSLNETTYLASVAELHYALKGTYMPSLPSFLPPSLSPVRP